METITETEVRLIGSANAKGSSSKPPTFFIIGGGPMALGASIELSDLAAATGYECRIVLIEDDRKGRHPLTSWRASQGWLHYHGVIYAMSQSGMLPFLQRSTRRLLELANPAFGPALGYAMATGSIADRAEAAFSACDIWYRRLTETQIKNNLHALSLPAETAVFQTRDRVIDLGLLIAILRRHCADRGVILLEGEAVELHATYGEVRSITLSDGKKIGIEPQDYVLVCAGPRGRQLLLKSHGVGCPADLRLFQSALVSIPAQNPVLAAYLAGGPTIVPMQGGAETRLILGNAERIELDGELVELARIPDQAVRVIEDVRFRFGISIPREDVRAWAGVKAEFVPLGGMTHSQSHGVRRLAGVRNGWLALPGKLSQAMSAASDLASAVLMDSCGMNAPVRETIGALSDPELVSVPA